MIHIATVHWRSAEWIGIQHRHFRRHIREPYRTYGFATGIEERCLDPFFYVCRENIRAHARKLNLLADVIRVGAAEDDILVFMDGDAFPVADCTEYLRSTLADYPVVAIRRDEKNEPWPHPAFCATTVGFWHEIGGDWSRGHKWSNGRGSKITNVGANLLKTLHDNNIQWHPMLRSNRDGLHPSWFAIYDDVIYHHGAAFRPPPARYRELIRVIWSPQRFRNWWQRRSTSSGARPLEERRIDELRKKILKQIKEDEPEWWKAV